MVKKKYGTGINIKSMNEWEIRDGCALGKQTRFDCAKSSPIRVKKVLEMIHSDVCGPMKTSNCKHYFFALIDDRSHFWVVHLMQNKSEIVIKFADFLRYHEARIGHAFSPLRSDNGGEDTSEANAKFCEDGFEQKLKVLYTS